MTSGFLHGRRPWFLSLHRSAAVIDRRRCAALAAGIVARPVFDNRVAGATTAESENCPWSSQFGFELPWIFVWSKLRGLIQLPARRPTRAILVSRRGQ